VKSVGGGIAATKQLGAASSLLLPVESRNAAGSFRGSCRFDFGSCNCQASGMKRSVLSANPLGQATSIAEQIENLQKESTSDFVKSPAILTAPAG